MGCNAGPLALVVRAGEHATPERIALDGRSASLGLRAGGLPQTALAGFGRFGLAQQVLERAAWKAALARAARGQAGAEGRDWRGVAARHGIVGRARCAASRVAVAAAKAAFVGGADEPVRGACIGLCTTVCAGARSARRRPEGKPAGVGRKVVRGADDLEAGEQGHHRSREPREPSPSPVAHRGPDGTTAQRRSRFRQLGVRRVLLRRAHSVLNRTAWDP